MNITNNTILIDEEFTGEYFIAGTWSVWALWLKKGDMDSAVMGVMKDSRMTNVVVIEKYTGMRSAKVDGVPQNLINSIFAVDDGIRRFEREQRNEGGGEGSGSRARPRPPSRWTEALRVSAQPERATADVAGGTEASPAARRLAVHATGEIREVAAETWRTRRTAVANPAPQQSEAGDLREAGRWTSDTIREILNGLNENQNARSI